MPTSTHLMTLLTHDLAGQQPCSSPLQGFLLVDGAVRTAVIQEYFLLEESPQYLPLFLGMTDESLSQSPYLIQIKDTSGDYLHWLSQEHPGLGFAFTSCLSLDEQIQIWQSLLVVNTAANSPCYFRFYDGHVARQLYLHGSEVERLRIFQLCHHLYFQNEQQAWQGFTLNHTRHHSKISRGADRQVRKAPWFTLSEETLNRITSHGQAVHHEIINMWWQHYPYRAHQLTHAELQKYASDAQRKFQRHQIHSWQQRALFACLMMEYQPDFDEHPDIAELFLEEQSYQQDGFGDRAMARIRKRFPAAWWRALEGGL